MCLLIAVAFWNVNWWRFHLCLQKFPLRIDRIIWVFLVNLYSGAFFLFFFWRFVWARIRAILVALKELLVLISSIHYLYVTMLRRVLRVYFHFWLVWVELLESHVVAGNWRQKQWSVRFIQIHHLLSAFVEPSIVQVLVHSLVIFTAELKILGSCLVWCFFKSWV